MAESKRTAASLLREIREAQGKSLRGAASDMGLAPSYLSRIERGERNVPEELTGRLASYYDVRRDLIELSEGAVPSDIVKILQDHPEILDRLRKEYPRSVDRQADVG